MEVSGWAVGMGTPVPPPPHCGVDVGGWETIKGKPIEIQRKRMENH